MHVARSHAWAIVGMLTIAAVPAIAPAEDCRTSGPLCTASISLDALRLPGPPEAVAAQRANLGRAAGITDILEGPPLSPTDEAAQLVEEATRSELRSLSAGVMVSPHPPGRSAGAALRDLVDTRRTALTPVDAEALAALDALDPAVSRAVAGVIDAFIAADREAAQAYRDASLADQGASVDRAPVLWARVALTQAAGDLVDAVAALPPESRPANAAPCTGPPDVVVEDLLAMDTLGCDTLYMSDVPLLVDLGGDDVYSNNAGGGSSFNGRCPVLMSADAIEAFGSARQPNHAAAALVDVAGNDRYNDASAAPFQSRACGVNGGGMLGSGFLYDGAGDDRYQSAAPTATPTNPEGRCVDLTFDLLLDDVPSWWGGGSCGANGGAMFGGVGTLIDLDGEDTYLGAGNGVNGGALSGSGLLVDIAGDDEYQGTSWGVNGGAIEWTRVYRPVEWVRTLASAWLIDAAGDDVYAATDVGTNAGAYLQAAGLLVDGGGADSYSAGRFGTNGGAVGTSAQSLLLDLAGDDSYRASERSVNGGASSFGNDAVGALVDALGNDRYEAWTNSVNGGVTGVLSQPGWPDARVFGYGLLWDGNGWDYYLEDAVAGSDFSVVPKTDGGTTNGMNFGAQVDTASPVDLSSLASDPTDPSIPPTVRFVVPASGTPVTKTLTLGSYRIVAEGLYRFGPEEYQVADAAFDYEFGSCFDRGNLLDLLVNDDSPWESSCDEETHTYETLYECFDLCDVTFRIYDTYYGDNAGGLGVRIEPAG